MEFKVTKADELKRARGTKYLIELKAKDEEGENHTLKFTFWDSFPSWARELGLHQVEHDDLIELRAETLKNLKQLHVDD